MFSKYSLYQSNEFPIKEVCFIPGGRSDGGLLSAEGEAHMLQSLTLGTGACRSHKPTHQPTNYPASEQLSPIPVKTQSRARREQGSGRPWELRQPDQQRLVVFARVASICTLKRKWVCIQQTAGLGMMRLETESKRIENKIERKRGRCL